MKTVNLKGVSEEHKRSVLKAISWRVVASSTTMSLVYILTGQLELTAGVGIGEVVLKMIFYFLHERGWNTISLGRSLRGTIESVMRSPPITALPSSSVSNAVGKMITSDIGSVIMSDGKKHYGLITEKDILESYELHANCYITKPIEFEKFLKNVKMIKDFWLSIVKLPRGRIDG